MKLLYIAGPYRPFVNDSGKTVTTDENVFRAERMAIRVANRLARYGVFPVTPHLNTRDFENKVEVNSDEYFLNGTMAILERCDAVLVVGGLDGERHSSGTRAEVARAKELNIPVFYGTKGVLQWAYGLCGAELVTPTGRTRDTSINPAFGKPYIDKYLSMVALASKVAPNDLVRKTPDSPWEEVRSTHQNCGLVTAVLVDGAYVTWNESDIVRFRRLADRVPRRRVNTEGRITRHFSELMAKDMQVGDLLRLPGNMGNTRKVLEVDVKEHSVIARVEGGLILEMHLTEKVSVVRNLSAVPAFEHNYSDVELRVLATLDRLGASCLIKRGAGKTRT